MHLLVPYRPRRAREVAKSVILEPNHGFGAVSARARPVGIEITHCNLPGLPEIWFDFVSSTYNTLGYLTQLT